MTCRCNILSKKICVDEPSYWQNIFLTKCRVDEKSRQRKFVSMKHLFGESSFWWNFESTKKCRVDVMPSRRNIFSTTRRASCDMMLVLSKRCCVGCGQTTEYPRQRQYRRSVAICSKQSLSEIWFKETADLHIILPREHRLIKEGLRMNMAIRGARAIDTVINITMFHSWNT
jgi:hypothetical protein